MEYYSAIKRFKLLLLIFFFFRQKNKREIKQALVNEGEEQMEKNHKQAPHPAQNPIWG